MPAFSQQYQLIKIDRKDKKKVQFIRYVIRRGIMRGYNKNTNYGPFP